MRILDRYVLRESATPFCLALGMFTFLLAVNPVLEQAQRLLAKGVDIPTTGFLLLTLLPQALGVTVPMAFLAGLLMALGRLSGDREAVALLACGVSPLRLLRPVLMMAVLVAAFDLYCMVWLVPNSNQRFRQETLKLLTTQTEADIKPGMFYEGFPGKVLYVLDVRPGGGWQNVMLADTSLPGRPIVTLAQAGYLEVDQARYQVAIVLPGESMRYTPGEQDGVYDVARDRDVRIAIPASSVFGDGNISRGYPEMTIAQLREAEAERIKAGVSAHPPILQRHQMFSFPVACLVFAVIGLALGLHTRKEGKLGGFTMGLGVICTYWAVFALAEARTKGGSFPAEWARWAPNIAMGLLGIVALWWRSRVHGGEIAITLPAFVRRWTSRPSSGPSPFGSRPPRVVLVVRLPQFYLPRPRLLDLYVSQKYLRVLLLTLPGLLCLYYIGAFIDRSEKLFKGQADGQMLLAFFMYSTPQFIAFLVPMAILVAVLATIGGLTRTSELVVMRSCGVSLYRAAMPLLFFALLLGGGLFLLDDRVLARANREAERLDSIIRSGTYQPVNPIASVNWMADKRRVFYYAAYDPPMTTLHRLSIFEISEQPFRLVRHIETERATFTKGAWRASAGYVQNFPTPDRSTRDTFTSRTIELPPPKQFAGLRSSDTELMTFGELRQHNNQLAGSGFNLAESQVDLQTRIAFPMVTLVMTLLGIPFGLTTGRRGALYGVGLAIIVAAAYWLLNTFFAAVGAAGLLPPVLAAWAANLLFLALALYMTLTVRT